MSAYHLPGLEALVFVRLPGMGFDRFERFLSGEAGVVAAWHVVGDVDLVVRVRCQDLADLEELVDRMRADGAASSTSVHLVLRQANVAASHLAGEPDGDTRPMSDSPAARRVDCSVATLFGRTTHAESVPSIVVGRHNDSDDVIIPAIQLPADTRPGDLLAVAGTGAYHHS